MAKARSGGGRQGGREPGRRAKADDQAQDQGVARVAQAGGLRVRARQGPGSRRMSSGCASGSSPTTTCRSGAVSRPRSRRCGRGSTALGHGAWVFAPAPGRRSRPGPRLPLPVDSRADLSRASRCRCRSRRRLGPPRPRARPRRRPRPPSVPARGDRRGGSPAGQRRPLVFTYHTRYEKYAHYVPLPPAARGRRSRCACRAASPTPPTSWWRPRSTSRDTLRRARRARARRGGPHRRGPRSLPPGRRRGRARRAARAGPPTGPSASTSAASTARRAWSACSTAFDVDRRRAVRRTPAPGRAGEPRRGARAAAAAAGPRGGRIHFHGGRGPRGAARRTTGPPISSSSRRRPRRRDWCWPRPTPAGCPRWRCGRRGWTRW